MFLNQRRNMKNGFLSSLLTAGLLLCTAGAAKAQDTLAPSHSGSSYASSRSDYNDASNVRTLAGCLEKGSSANEYSLRGEGLKSWQLTSDSVYLAGYLDDTIRVTVLSRPESDGTYVVTAVTAVVMTSCVR